MSRTFYFDRELQQISAADWKKKQSDKTYTEVRLYDNGVVRVLLKWVGRIESSKMGLAEYRPVFLMLVQNYKSDGTLANDPVDSDKYFPDEAAAVTAYTNFLAKWTESSVNETTGEFVEEGNIYTPPEPPDPNKSSSEIELLDGGAW